MSIGDVIAIVGDALVVVGLAVTVVLYLMQRASADDVTRQSALAVLNAAKTAIAGAPEDFRHGYARDQAEERSAIDYNAVMGHDYCQDYLMIAIEPLVTVLQQPGVGGRFILRPTIEAVNTAVTRIGHFNQMVQQQTDFNAQHAAEIKGNEIAEANRCAIAEAAKEISFMIHYHAIGDVRWYAGLVDALDRNIDDLTKLGPPRWWQLRYGLTSDVAGLQATAPLVTPGPR